MLSQFLGKGEFESEYEPMFSADEMAETDQDEFEDASESLTGATRFFLNHRAITSVDMSSAHLLIQGVDEVESVASPLLRKTSKRKKSDDVPSPVTHSMNETLKSSLNLVSQKTNYSISKIPQSTTLEIGIQTESLSEYLPPIQQRRVTSHSSDRNSIATFGGYYVPRHAHSRNVSKNKLPQLLPHGFSSHGHAPHDSISSALASDEFSANRFSLGSIRSESTSLSEQLTPGLSPTRSGYFASFHGLVKHRDSVSSTRRSNDQPVVPLQARSHVTTAALPTSPAMPPKRPNSPPPKELVERAQTLRSAQLSVPPTNSLRRSSYSSMPPPSSPKPRLGKTSPVLTGKRRLSNVNRPSKTSSPPENHVDPSELGQFGVAIMAPVVHSSTSSGRRKMHSSVGPSTEQRGLRSRCQSFNSDRTDHTSDPGDENAGRLLGNAAPSMSDPTAIHAITQTMIGEFLFKYTSKTLTRGFSEKRHRRFFWVHPYTKTLYWSPTDPGAVGTNQSTAKSVLIESIRAVDDHNAMPSGLASHSLLIQTPNREIKITAPSRERHELWFSAINYLLTRPDPSVTNSPAITTQTLSPNLSSRAALPSTFSSRNTMLSRFKSQDQNTLQTPPAVRQAIYGWTNVKSTNESPAVLSNGSSERLTPKASKGPSGLPLSTKRGATPAEGSVKQADLASRPAQRSDIVHSPSGGNSQDPSQPTIYQGEMEVVDETDISMSYDSRGEDTQDEGFEGVENVRVCCGGKHDVGSLSRRHHHSSTNVEHSLIISRPPSRGALKQVEGDGASIRAPRAVDSPNLKASNLEALRSRYGGANSPGPQAQAQAQQLSPYPRRNHGRNSALGFSNVSDSLHSSPVGTVSSRFHGESKFFQDLKSFHPGSVEQLQTPPRVTHSRASQRSILASSIRSVRRGSVASDFSGK